MRCLLNTAAISHPFQYGAGKISHPIRGIKWQNWSRVQIRHGDEMLKGVKLPPRLPPFRRPANIIAGLVCDSLSLEH